MKFDAKQLLSTPRGRLFFSLGLLACSWIFLFVYFFNDIGSLLPGASRIATVRQDIVKLSPAYEKAVAERAEAERTRKQYREMVRAAWIEARDGMVESGLRNQLNAAAQSAEASFNNLGSVKVSRVNSEFYLAELDVSLSGTYEGMIHFLEAVEALRPRVCWRRLDIRPDSGARRNTGNSLNLAAANSTGAETTTRVNVNGAVRVVGFDGKIPADIKFTPRAADVSDQKKAATAVPAAVTPTGGNPPGTPPDAPPPPPDGMEAPPMPEVMP